MSCIRGIVGFEIEVQDVQAIFKLSQNRDDKNQQSIIQKLRARGDEFSIQIAEYMEKGIT